MSKMSRKTKLLRDSEIDKLSPGSYIRVSGKRRRLELQRHLQVAVDGLAKGKYVNHEDYAEIIEVLKCLSFFHNIDWSDVEDSIWHQMVTKGKYINGVLQTQNTTDQKV